MASTDLLPKIAFLGLGAMGLCMSTHMYRSGFPLTGYDIWKPTLEKFKAQCATIAKESNISTPVKTASSPRDAVKGAEVVVLMVATHYHIESALFDKDVGAVYGLEKCCALIIAATVPPMYPLSVRKKLDEEFGRADVALVDAPVSGGTARAVDGTLTIMASADVPESLKRKDVKVVLDALAGNLSIIPGGLGSGTATKALNQVCCGIHITASSEIMGLAAVLGLDTKKFYEYQIQQDGERKRQGWSWMFENRGARMLQKEPPMASATAIIVKDVGIIMDETKRLSIDLPMVGASATGLKEAMDAGMSAEDDSCVVKIYLEKAQQQTDLVQQRVGNSALSPDKDDDLMKILCRAHACIHVASAYETVVFSEALNMSSDKQREQWYDIISGAAGGSTMFYEVVPAIFETRKYEDGIREYLGSQKLVRMQRSNHPCGETNESLQDQIEALALSAQEKGFEPSLLKLALGICRKYTD
jgi:3-hydroxyisobutyrate dehydrogenase-like beta-hydroxyacid dehydrogenase